MIHLENSPGEAKLCCSDFQDVPPEVSTSRRPGVDSDHPSTEQEDEERGEGPSGAGGTLKEEQTSRSRVRTACPYGKDCYRWERGGGAC